MTATGDQERFRGRFPGLAAYTHLASCSLAATSTEVEHAFSQMVRAARGHSDPWRLFEAQVQEARERFAVLVGARTDQVALLPSVSMAAYQVASGHVWWPRPRLLTTTAEWSGVAQVWLAQRPRTAEVVFVDRPGRQVEPADYLQVLDGRTGLVSIPLVTYLDGIRLPVARIAAAARAAGAGVFVDASQAVGVQRVDVDDLGCDWLVAGASKYLLGMPGVAFLFARDATSLSRVPRLTGAPGQRRPFDLELDFHHDARRFHVGTPPVPSVYAAVAGLTLLGDLDMTSVRAHVNGLLTYAAGRLAALGELVRTPDSPDERGAHLAVVDADPTRLADAFENGRVRVSARRDVVRIAVHYYSTRGDIDTACAALGEYRDRRSGTTPHTVRSSDAPCEV